MNRRPFIKRSTMASAVVALLPGHLPAQAEENTAPASSGAARTRAPGKAKVPDYAEHMRHSDMVGTGPDGKPTGQRSTFTGASKADAKPDPKAPQQMKLTKEEQDILNGSKGKEMAKVLKIIVEHGNAFGATKLVDLGGRPHSSLYFGTGYMKSMINLLKECADAGLKSYAPYTVNPRPYDIYNVQNNAKDMLFIYEGYALNREVDYIHVRLGAPDQNLRSCTCYLDEIGNAPKPGTYVAWAESSAVNYGNSVLGIRTNRNATGMELLCAMAGKAPYFGLMTDEGRMAKWLIEVKTSKEPNWAVVGTAIGRKVVEDVSYISGLEKYFPKGVNNENMHLLKQMGSASAASGAVALYHVEGVTPEAKEKGRKLLAKGHKTYIIDDAEQARILATFKNLWIEKNGDPNAAFLGCPHLTYDELLKWGRMVTTSLDLAGKEKAAMPVYLFVANPVRNRLVEEEGELASRMKRAGMRATNMCMMTYASMKGFSEKVRGVTNSGKGRNYSTLRIFPDQTLVEIIVTGKIPKGA